MQHGQVQASRKNKKGPNTKKHHDDGIEMWLTFVDESTRDRVIKEYLREIEHDFVERFRQQEVRVVGERFRSFCELTQRLTVLRQSDLFPQLVQTLRCEQPNRSRSYIKVVASNYALLGRIHSVLRNFPGAVDDIPVVAPLDIRQAPIEDLLRRAKTPSPGHPS